MSCKYTRTWYVPNDLTNKNMRLIGTSHMEHRHIMIMPCIPRSWCHVPCLSLTPIKGGAIIIDTHLHHHITTCIVLSLRHIVDVVSVTVHGGFKWVWVFQGGEALVGYLECSSASARELSLWLEVISTHVHDHCAQRHRDDVWYYTLVASLTIVWSAVLLPWQHSPSKLFYVFIFSILFIHNFFALLFAHLVCFLCRWHLG